MQDVTRPVTSLSQARPSCLFSATQSPAVPTQSRVTSEVGPIKAKCRMAALILKPCRTCWPRPSQPLARGESWSKPWSTKRQGASTGLWALISERKSGVGAIGKANVSPSICRSESADIAGPNNLSLFLTDDKNETWRADFTLTREAAEMFSSNHYAFNLTQDQDKKVMVLCGTDGKPYRRDCATCV